MILSKEICGTHKHLLTIHSDLDELIISSFEILREVQTLEIRQIVDSPND